MAGDRRVDTYDALVSAIEAGGPNPIYIAGERWVEIRGLELLCYVRPPKPQHGYGSNVEVRCGAQWVMGTPYRSEEAKTAFYTALADLLRTVAVVDKAVEVLR